MGVSDATWLCSWASIKEITIAAAILWALTTTEIARVDGCRLDNESGDEQLKVHDPEARALQPPRFSMIINFYNQRGFIKDALDSALSQKNAEFEIIAVDDGSTDGSQEILRGYGNKIRCVCLKNNEGHATAANRGASEAAGKYLAFLDGDDALAPWALDVYEQIIQAMEPITILASTSWFEGMLPVVELGGVRHEIQIVDYKDYLQKDRPFGCSASALVIDRLSFQRAGGWSIDVWPFNDLDLLLKLCTSGRTVQILAPTTVFRRSHAANTVKNIPIFLPAIHKIIHKAHRELYPRVEPSRKLRALVGGPVLHHAKKAIGVGLYWDAIKLLAHGRRMVLAAVSGRLAAIVSGRHPIEIIKMKT
jgi:glycosyltransferase involved in cell wall biosynthesis